MTDTNLERAKNELRQTLNEHFDQVDTTLAHALDDILIALCRLIESPKPTLPEHMLGLWAQHPEYGRVLVIDDRPDEYWEVIVAVRKAEHPTGAARKAVHVSELTFPHQVTKEELPTETEFNTLLWGSGGLTIHDKEDGQEVGIGRDDLAQLGYAMLAYAGETQPTPEYVETEEEYEALPTGSIVAQRSSLPWSKSGEDNWIETVTFGQAPCKSSEIAGVRRRVLRRGWG